MTLARQVGSPEIAALSSGAFFQAETRKTLEKVVLGLGDQHPLLAEAIYERLKTAWPPGEL